MGKNPVTVFLRTRPTANFAQDQILINQDDNNVKVVQRGVAERTPMDNKRDSWSFRYNQILHNAGQESTYHAVADKVVSNALDGVNGTIMAYGQTGAGKTFTMIGDSSNFKQRGVTPRAIGQVFDEIGERHQHDFNVSISYMELYNEKIFDLLDNNPNPNKDYTVIEDPDTRSMYVRGLTQEAVANEEEALGLLFRGDTMRTTAEHMLNKNSNRSHAIFTIHIEQRSRVRTENVVRSKLHLVDLAGSERLKKTLEGQGSTGKVDSLLKRESMYINKSLTYLEQVVIALTSKSRSHVPYRQTKLTNILKDSLGGNCSTSFIACIWGESKHLEETVSTLKLAQRMMRVQNEAVTNVQSNPEILVKRYERQILELKQELMMHDALANRSGVSYDEYTPEEAMQVLKMVRDYTNASPEEEDDVLKLESMRQIRECFKQFKTLYKNLEASWENDIGGNGRLNASPSNVRVGSIASTKSNEAEVENQHIESKTAVGEIDKNIPGFGVGNAPNNSRPPVLEQKMDFANGALSPTSKGLRSPGAAIGDESRPGTASGKEGPDRDTLFKTFIHEDGAKTYEEFMDLARETENLYEDMQQARTGIKISQKRIESIQTLLDEKKAEQKYNEDDDSGDIVDEEEYSLLKEMKTYKKAFRQGHSEYNMLRQQCKVKKDNKIACEARLLEQFNEWTLSARDTTENDDVLDDGECFDKLEIERVMSEDPDSVAFFKAQKAQRERARKHHFSPKRRR